MKGRRNRRRVYRRTSMLVMGRVFTAIATLVFAAPLTFTAEDGYGLLERLFISGGCGGWLFIPAWMALRVRVAITDETVQIVNLFETFEFSYSQLNTVTEARDGTVVFLTKEAHAIPVFAFDGSPMTQLMGNKAGRALIADVLAAKKAYRRFRKSGGATVHSRYWRRGPSWSIIIPAAVMCGLTMIMFIIV